MSRYLFISPIVAAVVYSGLTVAGVGASARAGGTAAPSWVGALPFRFAGPAAVVVTALLAFLAFLIWEGMGSPFDVSDRARLAGDLLGSVSLSGLLLLVAQFVAAPRLHGARGAFGDETGLCPQCAAPVNENETRCANCGAEFAAYPSPDLGQRI